MQPILTDLEGTSPITGNVSDRLATPSEIFAPLQDEEEISTTAIAPVASVDEFFDNLGDDIFEYELESTQSSEATPSSPVETRSMTWYPVAPEVQDTPLSPLSLTPRSLAIPSPPVSTSSSSLLSPPQECHLDVSLPLYPAVLLDIPSSLIPGSTMSLSLPSLSLPPPSPSLPQFSDQEPGPMSRTQSFLRSFVTAASLCSKIPRPPPYPRLQPLVSAFPEKSNDNFDLGIDIDDSADIANSSEQSQLGSDEITKLQSPRNNLSKPTESVEYLSVLAEILADYEESNDTPVVPCSSRSPFLPSIVLDVATFSSFSADDSVVLESPRATMTTPRIESPIDEHGLPASFLPSPKYLATSDSWSLPPSLPSIVHSPFAVPLATPYNQDSTILTNPRQHPCPSPMLSGFHAVCLPAIDAAFQDPLAPWSLDDGISDSLPKLPPLSRSHQLASGTAEIQHPPRTLSLAFPPDPLPDISSAPASSLNHPSPPSIVIAPALPLSSPSTLQTGRDTIATVQELAFESDHETRPASLSLGFCASGLSIPPSFDTIGPCSQENEQLSDKSSGEPNSRRSTTTPGTDLVRYDAPPNEPVLSGSPVLATHCDQGSTAPTVAPEVSQGIDRPLTSLFRDPRHCLSPPPVLSGSRATRMPSFDAVFWPLLVSLLFSLVKRWNLGPSPVKITLFVADVSTRVRSYQDRLPPRSDLPILSDPESPSPESPVTIVGTYWFPENRNQSGPAESSSARPLCHDDIDGFDVLDVTPLPIFAIGPAWRVSSPRIPFTRSRRLPRFRQLPISDVSLFIVRLFSLLANGLSHLVLSCPLVSRAICVVASSVFFVVFFSRSFPYVPPLILSCLECISPPYCVLALCLSSFPEIFFPIVVFLVFFLLISFSFGLAFFWFCFFDRGRSIFEVPRRGSQSPGSDPRAPDSTTSILSPPYKSLASTPKSRITPHPLAINPSRSQQSRSTLVEVKSGDTGKRYGTGNRGLALVVTGPAERSHRSYTGSPRLEDPSQTSGQPRDEMMTSQDRCSCEEHVPLVMTMAHPESDKHVAKAYTTTELRIGQLLDLEEKTSLSKDQLSGGQDRSQYPDHGSILPSLGRPGVFCRNFTMAPLLMTGPSARDLRPKGSDDDSTSGEGFPISRYGLENIERSLATTNTCFPPPEERILDQNRVLIQVASSRNQEGVRQPGMVGI